jgi:hypothetical protein
VIGAYQALFANGPRQSEEISMPEPDGREKRTEQTDTESPDVLRRRPLPPLEIGGRAGPDPTRYGDWEKDGRCIDF